MVFSLLGLRSVEGCVDTVHMSTQNFLASLVFTFAKRGSQMSQRVIDAREKEAGMCFV